MELTKNAIDPSLEARSLIDNYLIPSPGNSPAAIKERMLHWQERANHPERFVTDDNKYAVAAIRKAARQNFRKLHERHPHILSSLPKLDSTEVSA